MATNVDADTLTSEVLQSFSATQDERLKQILGSLTTHLHAAVSRLFLSRAGDRRDPRTSGAAHRAPLR